MANQSIPFPAWRPDQTGVNSQYLRDLNNVLVNEHGYHALPSLAPQTSALPGEPVGMGSVIDENGNGFTIVGSPTNLYRLIDGDWVDITRLVGGDYSLQFEDRWRYSGYNQDILATSRSDVLQVLDMNNPLNFANAVATGDPIPRAKYIGTFGPFVILGSITGITDGPRQVQWSGINEPFWWTFGERQSGFQQFTEGGPITGLVSGEIGYVLLQDKMWQFTYQPGSPFVFQIDEIENQRGCIAPDSLIHTGDQVFFYSFEGFLNITKGQGGATNIGSDKINEYFRDNAREDRLAFIKGAADPSNTRVFWSFVSNDNAGIISDKVVIYDWSQQEWSKASVVTKDFANSLAQGRTLDGLDVFASALDGKTDQGNWTDATAYVVDEYVEDDNSLYICINNHTSDSTTKPGYINQGANWEDEWVDAGNLDALPASLDSPQWAGGDKFISVFDTNDRLSTFTGPILEAVFETNDIGLNVQGRAYVEYMTPHASEAQEVLGQVAVREQLKDNVDLSPENGQEFNGTIPIHKSGRYIRVKLRVPAGVGAQNILGVDLELKADGSV